MLSSSLKIQYILNNLAGSATSFILNFDNFMFFVNNNVSFNKARLTFQHTLAATSYTFKIDRVLRKKSQSGEEDLVAFEYTKDEIRGKLYTAHFELLDTTRVVPDWNCIEIFLCTHPLRIWSLHLHEYSEDKRGETLV